MSAGGFYERLEAHRAASFFPVVCGVTGGLEGVCAAAMAIGGDSPMMALGSDLVALVAGSIDATESMPAGSSMPAGPGVASPQRWVRR